VKLHEKVRRIRTRPAVFEHSADRYVIRVPKPIGQPLPAGKRPYAQARVQIEDEAEPDQRPPLKLEPRRNQAPPFRSTMLVRFYVRDGNMQWWEQDGPGWRPIPWPTY
jgi:hypothetical protein